MKKHLCQICMQAESKYKCPKCLKSTCSIHCVKLHKINFNCDGKQDKNVFLKRNEININTLFSDSAFLQDIKQHTLTQSTDFQQIQKNNQSQANNSKVIVKHAASNNTVVKVMPLGLSRAKLNQSKYIKKRKEISWTIEWIFHEANSNALSIFNHRNLETDLLGDLQKKTAKSLIEQNAVIDSSPKFIYIKDTLYSKNKHETYFLLDPLESVRNNLIGCQVFEFPTFMVHSVPLPSEQVATKPILDYFVQIQGH